MAGHKRKSSRARRKRKAIVFIIELAILAIVLFVLFFYQFFYKRLDLIDTKEIDKTKVEVNDISEETAEVLHGHMTVAVFGLDNREQGAYGSGNSDVIMLISIDNDTKEVSMVSIYRDTYLNVAGVDDDYRMFRKANAAYAYGGAEQAITMLNRNLDLDVDNYVTVDFKAVAEAIDILGGIEIEITSDAELDYLNDYIYWNNRILGTSSPYVENIGKQTLDGVQAVAYSRIRYTTGGDFKRAERQRRVFSQMMEKANEANLSQINSLINTVFPDVETSLTKKEILSLAKAVIGYDMSESAGFPYDRTTDTPSKEIGSIVIPCDLESNVIKLHAQLYGTNDYEPSETVREYSDYIINNTGKTAESAIVDEFSESDDFTGTGSTQ